MTDLLWTIYPWVKAVHVMSVIAWMAGLFYLPRLFVYHVEKGRADSAVAAVLTTMEERLMRVIMTPAMISSWGFGLLLVATPGVVQWAMVWPWIKAIGIVAMTGFHIWLAQQRRRLAGGEQPMTGRQYRLMNEVPTVLMVAIVLSVVVKF